MRTRSEAYFLDLFKSATLSGAVEKAAESEREQLLDGSARVPIDVFGIAARRRVRVRNDLVGSSCEEGLLIPFKGCYEVRLKKSSTESRRRFSLAHELGHTLFYRDAGNGPRHQIGVLSSAESVAEERICNLFASALLMPPLELRESLSNLPSSSPSRILDRLEAAAQSFRVSLPALLQRLRGFQLSCPSYLLVYLTHRTNPSTGADATLRVDSCVNVGSSRPSHIWRNRSAEGVGLKMAQTLYGKWQEKYQGTSTRGTFVLDADSAMVTAEARHGDFQEMVMLSHTSDGKWVNEATRVVSASRLYVWNPDEEHAAYVIAALTPNSRASGSSPFLEPDSHRAKAQASVL